MSRLVLYDRTEPERDRWLPGDRFVRPILRRAIRGKPRPGGLDRVFMNLCLGLDRLGITYAVNLPFRKLRDDDRVGVLGRGRHALDGYPLAIPFVAGIGLMTHPSEWPTLCQDYPIIKYLQHSAWANDVYRPYFGNRCAIWPVGIDTEAWVPSTTPKDLGILIYDKVRWERPHYEPSLIQPIRDALARRGLRFTELRYGSHTEDEFRERLSRSQAMVFLCEHESQGLACQECLSSDVPVLAWDQGWCLDPNRERWGMPEIPATSVPYFDARCGGRFRGVGDFEAGLDEFLDRLTRGEFRPRDYILEHLTVERCSAAFLEFFAP